VLDNSESNGTGAGSELFRMVMFSRILGASRTKNGRGKTC